MKTGKFIMTLAVSLMLAQGPALAQVDIMLELGKKAVGMVTGKNGEMVYDPAAFLQSSPQFSENLHNTLENLSYMKSQLEAARNMADNFQRAYSVYDALFVGGDQLVRAYREVTGLIDDADRFNKTLNELGQKGGISLREVNDLIYRMEAMIRNATEAYESVSRITDRDVNLDIRARIDLLNQVIGKLRGVRKEMNDELEAAMAEAEAQIAVTTAEQLMNAFYDDVDAVEILGKKIPIPSAKEIYQKIESAEGATVASAEKETEAAVKKNEPFFRGRDGGGLSNLAGFVLLAIGLLSVIFGIPVFLKTVSGERQSRNALWKWIAGTLAMVGIVFLFDLVIL